MTLDATEQRVVLVQAQARRSMWVASGFVVASAAAVVAPHDTGSWLPLHLFLVGGLVSAISGAAQLFAVTWAAGPAPSDASSLLQRSLVASGAVLLAAGRELEAPRGVTAAGGVLVVAGLALLAALLVREVRGGVQRRFDSALRWYLAALTAGAAGAGLGMVRLLGAGDGLADRLRSAHLALNLLGLIGLSIAGTLPFFTATEARVKMSPRAGTRRQGALLCALAGAVALAAAGLLTGNGAITATGLMAYALGLVGMLTVLPPIRRKQLQWAGPRLAQLGAGIGWWGAAVCGAALRASRGDPPFSSTVVAVLVIGGFAQVLAAAVAYLGPVLRAGGHERLSEGFALTRSPAGLVAANVAAGAATFGARDVAAVAVAFWLADAVVRGVLLARPRSGDASMRAHGTSEGWLRRRWADRRPQQHRVGDPPGG